MAHSSIVLDGTASLALEWLAGKLILAVCLALGVCLPGLASEARADYPQDRPLNIIVPFGPGGAVDIASRILAEYFRKN